MNPTLLSALCLAGIIAVSLTASINHASSEDAMIDYINNLEGNTWKAGRNVPNLKVKLGTDVEANILYNKLHLSYPEIVYPNRDLPKNFDAREQWPQCTTIKNIRNQANCGSCWAFGTVEAISDRICIHKNLTSVTLSPQDPTSCCTDCGYGCNGGYYAKAYQYWIDTGIVTGGPYNSKQGCYPYEIEPNTGANETADTPPCKNKCIEGYPKSWQEDKYYGSKSYGIDGVENVMNEIVTNGPVTAGFMVYEDFPFYKSGVYKHVFGKRLDGHAIKIIGYGTENGQDYWLCANSWSPQWGLQGFFKIAKGNNECQIESGIAGGLPK